MTNKHAQRARARNAMHAPERVEMGVALFLGWAVGGGRRFYPLTPSLSFSLSFSLASLSLAGEDVKCFLFSPVWGGNWVICVCLFVAETLPC